MSYTTVTTYTAKLRNGIKSDCICCSERRLIKTLKHDFYKRGYRPHQFSSWVSRKHGTLVISRKTSYGDGISLPCVLCRKMIDKYNFKWIAHDGCQWINSQKSTYIPKSQPTNKQKRLLRFGLNN